VRPLRTHLPILFDCIMKVYAKNDARLAPEVCASGG